MNKDKYNDGYDLKLIKNTSFVGKVKMPEILKDVNVSIPKKLISFTKIKNNNDTRGYVHFFIHDKYFKDLANNIDKYIPVLSKYDGVLTPDYSMAIGQLDYLQKTNNYYRQAVGAYLQRNGIPIIPTVRWSDERSLEYCLNGIPRNYIIAISTHGCIKTNKQKVLFRKCLIHTIKVLRPTDIIVYGYMPLKIFNNLEKYTSFHRYPNHFEQNCKKGEKI